MRTISINQNFVFRRLYHSGTSKVSPFVAVYVRKNKQKRNRLGITTSKKLGGAVQRNRAKRVIKEAYRLLEPELIQGFDIVIVARTRSVHAKMPEVQKSLRILLSGLGLFGRENAN